MRNSFDETQLNDTNLFLFISIHILYHSIVCINGIFIFIVVNFLHFLLIYFYSFAIIFLLCHDPNYHETK